MNTYMNGSRQKPVFSNLSIFLSVGAVVSLLVPYIAVPVAVMSIIFGAISLKTQEGRNGTAIAGIAVSSAALLIGAALIISLAALAPYMEDLREMFSAFMPVNVR